MLTRHLFHLHKLRKNLRLELSKLQEIQRDRLRAIIKHAYENVPLYHRKFDEAGIKPEDVKSVDDLSKVPMITKSEIQASVEDLVARNVDANRYFKRKTSGSTGLPLTVMGDGVTRDFRDALWTRALLENGLRLRDRKVTIGDPHYYVENRGLLRLLRRKYISVFDDVKRQLGLLEDYRPDVIKGYPSCLTMLADACRRTESFVKPRLVFTVGELLEKWCRKLISSVFECELIDCYACAEFGLLTWECHEHMGYHMNIDSVVMEVLDNGGVVAPGERGEIVCTSLHNYVMPLIRYRLGDIGIPIEEQCSCGRSLPLMKLVEGRADDFLTALDGRIVSPLVFSPYPFENLEGIRQFKVIQKRKDKLTIQLVLGEDFSNRREVFQKATRKIQELFGEGMYVDFQILAKINRDRGGKLRKVISRVPVPLDACMQAR